MTNLNKIIEEREKIIERIEVIINRHSPMPNFEIKELAATEIYEQVFRQSLEMLLEELAGRIERMEKDYKADFSLINPSHEHHRVYNLALSEVVKMIKKIK